MKSLLRLLLVLPMLMTAVNLQAQVGIDIDPANYIRLSDLTVPDAFASISQDLTAYTATNIDACDSAMTAVDSISPVAMCKDLTIYLNAFGVASVTAADVNDNSTDNCQVVALGIDKSSYTCAEVGANSATLTVSDQAGNVDQCQSTITALDTVAPIALCKDATIYLDASGMASIMPGDIDNGSNDACGIASLSLDNSGFNLGDVALSPITVTLFVVDVNGNASTCSALVTVIDTSSCEAPQDLLVTNLTSTSAKLQWSGNAASYQVIGNRLGDPTVSFVTSAPEFQVNNLLPNTGYYWTVLSLCGDSTISSMETDTFFTEAFCQPATNVQTINIGPDSAVLSWTPSPNALRYRLAAAEVPVDPNAIFFTTVNAPASSYTLKNLTPGKDYKWRIIAQCAYEASPLSPIVDFTTIDVSDPDTCNITLATNAFPASCNGFCDGTAAVNPSGGTPPYTYLWDANAGTQITQTATDLCGGIYTVSVTDAIGCTTTGTAEVLQPAPLVATLVGTPTLSCAGECDGVLTLSATGGNGNYFWAFGGIGGPLAAPLTATGLCAGSYTVTVEDIDGCVDIVTAVVNSPAPLSVTAIATPVSCYGFCDGTATANLAGGTPPYTYLWSNGATIAFISELCAGTYTVTATDANGCNVTGSVVVNEPTAISISAAVTDVLCNGGNTGAVDLTVTGGTPPYPLSWSNGAVTEDISGLFAGTYTGTVLDANGCDASATVTVNEPLPFFAMIFSQAATCDTICDGVLVASTLGGSGTSNTFQWDDVNSQTTAIATGLCPGTYSVTATDANGCIANATNVVGSLCKSGLTETPTNESLEFNLHPNPANDHVTISCEKVPNGWTLYTVDGRAVGQSNSLDPLNSTWQIGLREYATGIYFLQIDYKDHHPKYKLIIQR